MELNINPNHLPMEFVEQIPLVQDLKEDANKFRELMGDLSDVKIPYIIKGKTILAEGRWNDNWYSAEEIKKAVANSDWNDKKIRELFLDHKDGLDIDNPKVGGVDKLVGEIQNIHYEEGKGAVGDLVIIDLPTAIKLAYGMKIGISAKVDGLVEDHNVKDFVFLNNSIVINPACKRAWINNAEVRYMDKEEKLELTDLKAIIEELAKSVNERLSKLEKLQEEPEPEAPEEEPVEAPVESKVEEEAPEAPEEEPVEAPEEPKEEIENKDIEKLNKKIEELEERLNEPEKIIEKGEVEVKTETLEEKLRNASDEEINELQTKIMLRAQGTFNLGDKR